MTESWILRSPNGDKILEGDPFKEGGVITLAHGEELWILEDNPKRSTHMTPMQRQFRWPMWAFAFSTFTYFLGFVIGRIS